MRLLTDAIRYVGRSNASPVAAYWYPQCRFSLPAEYNTLSDSSSGSEAAPEDGRHMIVEEEPGDEEDPVTAAAEIGRLSLSDTGLQDG